MCFITRDLQVFGDGIFGQFFELRVNNNINNTLAGIQYFLCKIFGYKNGGFCYPEIQLAWVYTI